jgi:hypothetical protein
VYLFLWSDMIASKSDYYEIFPHQKVTQKKDGYMWLLYFSSLSANKYENIFPSLSSHMLLFLIIFKMTTTCFNNI